MRTVGWSRLNKALERSSRSAKRERRINNASGNERVELNAMQQSLKSDTENMITSLRRVSI